MGDEKAEVVEKLTLKRKDLENKEGEVIVLSAQGARLPDGQGSA